MFGGNNCFVTTLILSLIKDGSDNLFPEIHLHKTNAFFEDLTGKHNSAYKLHFLHTDLPTLHKQVCFSTAIPPLLIDLECSPMQLLSHFLYNLFLRTLEVRHFAALENI